MTNAAAGWPLARVAVGRENGVLLVPHQHVPYACQLEATVQLDVVHSWDAENNVDAVRGECLDDVTPDGPGSRVHALEMLAPATAQ